MHMKIRKFAVLDSVIYRVQDHGEKQLYAAF